MTTRGSPLPRCRPFLCAAASVALLALLVLLALFVRPLPARADDQAAQTIYRYKNRAGRSVYVNGLERVPPARRQRARVVDLSRVSLNEALGTELQAAASQQVAALLGSGYCTGARRGAARGWWGTLWHDHGHLVLVGGALALLLLASPWLLRTIGGPQWSKVLLVALPALAVLALISSAAVKANRTLGELRGAADACRPERYSAAQDRDPAARAHRVHRIFELEQRVRAAGGERSATLDAILSGAP
ncbi:MAG: hypothetical protein IPL40_12295 [Proteobacteria bacterium]|nr:hypothetical protein [Pseudomonadota bacterium]